MAPWNPWTSIAELPVEVRVGGLNGERGRWTRSAERDLIVLDSSLDRQTRREVLAHELVHAERRVGWPQATAETMQLEEERVWRVALRRLAPPDEIARLVRRRRDLGGVTVADVAEEFDLSQEAAQRVVTLFLATCSHLLPDDDP
jgi:hypothetical protein